jgi:hypothetical protein
MVSIVGRVPVDVSEVETHAGDNAVIRAGAVVSNAEAAANLRRDSRAAAKVTIVPADGHETPMEHVLSEAETHVSEEGENLLATPLPGANGAQEPIGAG